jgi:hypothetical protein
MTAYKSFFLPTTAYKSYYLHGYMFFLFMTRLIIFLQTKDDSPCESFQNKKDDSP